MSKISQALQRLATLRAFVARVRNEVPKAAPLLDALQQDDYEQAWQTFAGYGDVAEILRGLPAHAQPYVSMIGARFMEALDVYVDEDAIEEFLRGVALLDQV